MQDVDAMKRRETAQYEIFEICRQCGRLQDFARFKLFVRLMNSADLGNSPACENSPAFRKATDSRKDRVRFRTLKFDTGTRSISGIRPISGIHSISGSPKGD